ncbi:MAG: hypothetical protein JO069_03410, partial [Verrucomicrobia bacterium]|nr:hypothetical protein [Verrucomicrobiota bacterium]
MSPDGVNGSTRPMDELDRYGKKIQALIERIDALAASEARELIHECLETVLAFYGKG